jgi:hypothetical protein
MNIFILNVINMTLLFLNIPPALQAAEPKGRRYLRPPPPRQIIHMDHVP